MSNKIIQPKEGSRRWIIEQLAVGESVCFECGVMSSTELMRVIAGIFKNGQNLSNQGFTQKSGLLVFDGEVSTKVVRVTRVSDPI